MTHENLLARIQKMLALAKSAKDIGSVEEAATAAALAQKLMVENKIAMADLTDLENKEEIPIIEYDVLAEEGGKSPRAWKWDLLIGIANNNFCSVLKWAASWEKGQRPGTGMRRGKLMLLGTRADVDVVLYMYRWLVREVDRLAKKAGKTKYDPEYDGSKRTWMDCFRKGAAKEIRAILDRKRREQQQELPGQQVTALVRADDEIVAYVKKHHPKLSYRKRSVSNWNDSAFQQGKAAAHSINLDRNAKRLNK